MAKLFMSKPFKEFLEELEKMEMSDLDELVRPTMMSDKITVNEYTFLIRGRLEVYDSIRALIAQVISFYKKNAS